MASEGQCKTNPQTVDNSESPKIHEASSICRLDGVVVCSNNDTELETKVAMMWREQ